MEYIIAKCKYLFNNSKKPKQKKENKQVKRVENKRGDNVEQLINGKRYCQPWYKAVYFIVYRC